LRQTVAITEFLTRTRFGWLDAEDARLLDDQGYLLLRVAIPAAWIGPLRDAFEAGALPSEKWPVPRSADWRHSLLEQMAKDPCVAGRAHGSGRSVRRLSEGARARRAQSSVVIGKE
jgi:hypothetical protein